MLQGEFHNTLDEKGRISIPKKMQESIPENTLVVTRGLEECLWAFTLDEWESFSRDIMDNTTMFDPKARLFNRRVIAPAQKCTIDSANRLQLPVSLRSAVYLEPKDTVLVLGMAEYIEIWNMEVYNRYLDENHHELVAAGTELAAGHLKRKQERNSGVAK